MAKKATAVKTEAKTEKAVVKLTTAQNKAVENLETVSAKIRYLDSEGYSRSEIAKTLGKRYQHVRNVLITPITKARS